MTLLNADKRIDNNEVGEDTEELFEAVEESFGVNLGEFDSLAGIRISELAETISKLANYPASEKCLSAVAFYKVRRSLTEVAGVPSRSIRPSTPTRELFPWISRKAKWRSMRQHLGLSFPELGFPTWTMLLSLTLPTTLVIFSKESIGIGLSWPEVVFCSLALIACAIWACFPLARSIPRGCETFGALARMVLARNYAVFAKNNAGSSENDVLYSLRLLIAGQTGREIGEVFPGMRIPGDLDIY